MDLPIDDKEFEYIVRALWRCRGTEKRCGELYEKLQLIKDVRDENPDGPYKKILRETYGMAI
jgi:hypothetical protein|tara:strand:+ start:746 stop:931 length:186 start_codon:yes stop_codon:yes gene_type:complete